MFLLGFYINLPLGSLVAIPLLLVHIPDQIPKKDLASVLRKIHHHLDLIGFAIFAPAVIMLLLALQYGGNDFAWSSSQVIGLFCGSGAAFTVLYTWNYYKGYSALLPFPIIRRRSVWASGLNYTVIMSSLFGVTYFLPVYFQAVKGVKAITSGVYLLAMILPQMLVVVMASAIGNMSSLQDSEISQAHCLIVNKLGYVPPFAIISGALTAIGTGLFSCSSRAPQPVNGSGLWFWQGWVEAQGS